jgi:hypothetical protein
MFGDWGCCWAARPANNCQCSRVDHNCKPEDAEDNVGSFAEAGPCDSFEVEHWLEDN